MAVATLRSNYRLSLRLLPYVCDSHQDGENEDRQQRERLCFHYYYNNFIYNGLHFSQVKLASERPVWEKVIFPRGACPQTLVDYGVRSTPSLTPYGNLAGQGFSLLPTALREWVHMHQLSFTLKSWAEFLWLPFMHHPYLKRPLYHRHDRPWICTACEPPVYDYL